MLTVNYLKMSEFTDFCFIIKIKGFMFFSMNLIDINNNIFWFSSILERKIEKKIVFQTIEC